MRGGLFDKFNKQLAFSMDNLHQDDLKAIWMCHKCRTVFLFHSDVDDHKDLSGHKMIEKVMMTISPAETSS